MRLTRRSLLIPAIAAVGILGLTGCTDSGAPAPDDTATVDETIEFEAGTTMAELNEAGAITVGTKFDQPLFGQVDASGNPQGFDVEIAKLVGASVIAVGRSEKKLEVVKASGADPMKRSSGEACSTCFP